MNKRVTQPTAGQAKALEEQVPTAIVYDAQAVATASNTVNDDLAMAIKEEKEAHRRWIKTHPRDVKQASKVRHKDESRKRDTKLSLE